jgi:predicted  nucleic acid-binding Zn-ribbon protein
MALDPERLDGNDAELMDVGDNKFLYFKQSKFRYENNIRREENEEDDDGDLSVNSSVNSRNDDESPLTCAMPPNITDFLTYVDSSRL